MFEDHKNRIWLHIENPPWTGSNGAVFYDIEENVFVAGGTNLMFVAFSWGVGGWQHYNLEEFELLMFSNMETDRNASAILLKCFEGYGETQHMKDWSNYGLGD